MNNLVIWPIVIPLFAALVAVLLPGRSAAIGVISGVATLGASIALVMEIANQGPVVYELGGWKPGLGIALHADGLSTTLLLMSSTVALAVAWYATGYFNTARRRSQFWPIWLLLSAALHAMFLSADLFNLYVTLELVGLSAVALTALGQGNAAISAALRYLTVGLVGSMAFLAGVALIYIGYGTLNMLALAELLRPEPTTWLAVALMSVGLMVKSALFPMHFWLPQAHANAPAPVSAVLSALVVKAAVYLMLRLWMDLFAPSLPPHSAWILGALGAIAVLWGSWNAMRAERLKLLAAYSTVAQLGYLFIFFPLLMALPEGPLRETAFGALVLMALTHGYAKSALFLAAGIIQHRAGHDRIADLGGTAQSLPVTTFALALAGIALIGLPPSGAFLAKWQLLATSFALGQWVWIPVVAAGSLMAAAYVFRILGSAFGPAKRTVPALADSRMELPGLLLAIVATAVLGLGASAVWSFVAPDAFSMEAVR